ncbi:hypothetical protein JZU68_07770, partial [bacterium]|nr:hypothetical protein [bacterium]
MSQRLKNIYTHLIQNRKHQLLGWYNAYKEFATSIGQIRDKLQDNCGIRDKNTYAGTIFEKGQNPFDDFIHKLIYEQSNGISSRGQSVLSWENLTKFKQSPSFDEVIKNLIIRSE